MKRPQYFAAKPIADEYIPIENEIVLWRSVLDQAMQDIAYTGRDKEYIKFRVQELEKEDPVNYPAHYNKGGIGCIDAIKACQGEGFKYYLQGSAMKYLWRYEHKEKPIQDLEKAKWFINKLIEITQERDDESNKEHGDSGSRVK